jgi:glyoxylase-like metal-dependent hydrolase (beta-lactamase superfamily II)
MEQVAPGIFHWSATHPDIQMRVSSYYVEPAGIVIDPLEPDEGMGFFDALEAPPQQVVLTSGLHWRHSDRFRDRYDATIRAPSKALHRFEGTDRRPQPYDFGDEVAPAVTAIEIGGICPDDTALHVDHGPGAVAFADGLTRMRGTLGFVPDTLWEDPRAEQQVVLNSLRGVLERDFDVLLFAHGEPLARGGHAALAEFVDGQSGAPDFGHTS